MRFSIADTIVAKCFAHPGRIAIEMVEDGRAWTYGEAWCRIHALAEAIRHCTDGRHGKTLGLLLPNGADAALAIAACQLQGVIAVPVNGRLTAAEMQYIARDADLGLVLSSGSLLPRAQEAFDGLGIAVLDAESIATPQNAPRPALGQRELGSEPAVIGYTSGTTGFPKGAVYTHDYYSMNNYRWGWSFALSYEHVMLIAGPMFHLSYAGFTLAGLAIGCRMRIMEKFQPEVALAELRDHCSFAFLVPSMLAMVADHWKALGRPPLSAARHIISAGAPSPLELLRTEMQMFSNAKIAEMYGWTEGTFATYEIKEPNALEPNSVGWPAIGADVVVFDAAGEPITGPGQAGEVGVRSGVEFAGYLGNPEATAQSLHRGYIMSGDVGRWLPDGRLCIIDRIKDVIISGGENIYTAEVERVLLEHPGVAEAAALGLPDDKWGEMVAALIVVREGKSLDEAELLEFCRERMAGYKQPRRLLFVTELPRNSMGKVQKFRAAELFGQER
jgi:acyl-CoA synthetase (AMP-forming)/AMP-acid ligase II